MKKTPGPPFLQDNIESRPDDFSLLWPPGSVTDPDSARAPLSPSAARDLGLAHLVICFSPNPERQKEILQTLATLCQDPAVIRYRQEVLEDLLRHPQLAVRLEALLPTIESLSRFSFHFGSAMNTMHELSWRMGELQGIVECIQGLGEVFEEIGEDLSSTGLRRLQADIAGIRSDPDFQALVRELPDLLDRLRTCASVTIGVNLDPFLRPVEATLLSVNEEKFSPPSMLGRLLGKTANRFSGIAPLHSVPRRVVEGPYALPINSELGWAAEPMMVPLFRDLANVLEKVTKPIAQELWRYNEFRGRMFAGLQRGLSFYLGALSFIKRMQAHGLPMCLPEMAHQEERTCQVEEAYNANLALTLSGGDPERDLSGVVIQNDIDIGPQGRILILTGPNQGGKTTYLQGTGLIQVLAQAGLYVPGTRARISPVDQVYTHFPLEEKMEADTGRFGDEARRLGEIFQQVSRTSLILLNESLSSTYAGESLYLAQDVVRILRRIGARTIYSTHLHELAAEAEEINRSTPGDSRVASLVSSPVEEHRQDGNDIHRSYRIEARPPMGRSYAGEIAARYGIGYEQLEQLLAKRGILDQVE